jgi:serine/threonine-protein kinase
MDGTLEEATRRYGDDADVWWARGDALFHFAAPAGAIGTPELAAIFERAIALDSTFAPAYLHPIEIAFGLSQDAHARQLLKAYLDLDPSDFSADGARIVRAITEYGTESAAARKTIASASSEALLVALDMIGLWPDSTEASVALARQYLANANAKVSETDRADARFYLARQLGLRGHLGEAYRTLTRADIESTARGRRFSGELALLGFFPAESARALVERFRIVDSLGPRSLLPWLALQHDTARIRRITREAGGVLADADIPVARRNNARYTAESAGAYLALANADTTTALRLFVALPDSLCQYCFIDRLQRIQLLRATGRAREASLDAREIKSRYRAPGTVLFALEAGRIGAVLGDATAARKSYEWALASWRHADPLLEPFVREARTELQGLAAR